MSYKQPIRALRRPWAQHPSIQSSQTAFFASSSFCFASDASSLSLSRLFRSFSRITRSYSLSSSVRLGALLPMPAAIMRAATDVVFSGLRAGPPPAPGAALAGCAPPAPAKRASMPP